MVTELERFRQRERERIAERRTIRTAREGMLRERAEARDVRAKSFGGFFTSVPGAGVRKAFGEKTTKKKKGKKKTKKVGFKGRGPLAESPGNILVDRPVRNPFLR
ncbi:hypothetical protein LCGC14_1832990 [marine sediment metagenome]|uniref:Uncharacterized protein n=1 Tax=marine sediment metagenome TaxID=412755 RepID=A0A0F9IV13_9ZZZZ